MEKEQIKISNDWIANSKSTFSTMGASNHSLNDRSKHDYYATEPKAVKLLLEVEKFDGKIWECACGEGHLSKEMKRLGYEVYSTDLIDRGFQDKVYDFLGVDNYNETEYNIITNPPYKFVNQWILKSMDILQKNKKLALFLPIRYLEGKERKNIYLKYPPKNIYMSSSRLKCAINGKFNVQSGSAASYAWFVWQKGYTGDTKLSWIN